MSTETKRKKSKRKQVEGADFLLAPELAAKLNLTGTKALWRAIRDGLVPLPTHTLGERRHQWRLADYEQYRDTGHWPKGMKFQPVGGS